MLQFTELFSHSVPLCDLPILFLKGQAATLTAEESVGGILNTLSCLTEKDNGTFVNWEGAAVPW